MVWLEGSNKDHTEDIKEQAANMEREECFIEHWPLSKTAAICIRQAAPASIRPSSASVVPSREEQTGGGSLDPYLRVQYSLLPLPVTFDVILHTASRSQVSLEHID